MVSPLIERSDDGIVVRATEMQVRLSPWGELRHDVIDSAFVTVGAMAGTAEVASVSRTLTRDECIAISEAFARIADQIPVRVAA